MIVLLSGNTTGVFCFKFWYVRVGWKVWKITHVVVIRCQLFVTFNFYRVLLLWIMTCWGTSWFLFVTVFPFPLLLHAVFANITAFLTGLVSITRWEVNLALWLRAQLLRLRGEVMIHVGLHFEEGPRMPTMLVTNYVTLLTCDICDILCLLIVTVFLHAVTPWKRKVPRRHIMDSCGLCNWYSQPMARFLHNSYSSRRRPMHRFFLISYIGRRAARPTYSAS